MADPLVERLVASRRGTSASIASFISALEEAPRDLQAVCPYWVIYGVSLKPIAIRRKADGALLAALKPLGVEGVALVWARSAGDIRNISDWTRRLVEISAMRAEENEAMEELEMAWRRQDE